MVSKRWQKSVSIVQHGTLAVLWGGTLFWLQLDLNPAQKVMLIVFTAGMALSTAWYLNDHLNGSLIKVYRHESDAVISIVQRALNASTVPFSRRSEREGVSFAIRGQDLTLTVKAYPLNLPVDDHIRPVPASKVEIHGLNAANQPVAEKMCQAIDETMAASIKSRPY